MRNPRARGLRAAAEVSQLTAEYMMGIFDYTTWNIYDGPRWVGQVTINTTDNTASFTAGDAYLPAYQVFETASVASWGHWLYEHGRPRGSHETAF